MIFFRNYGNTTAVLLALWSSVSLAQNSTPSAEAPPSITVTVRPQRTVYRQSAPLEVIAAVRNNTGDTLSLQTGSKTPPIFLRVKKKEGGFVMGVSSKPAVKTNSSDPKYRTTSQTLVLAPDETKEYVVDIQAMSREEGSAVSLPTGKYAVQAGIVRVLYEAGHYRGEVLTSEWVEFSIE